MAGEFSGHEVNVLLKVADEPTFDTAGSGHGY